MKNYNEKSFEELKEIKDVVSALLKEKKAEHKEELKAEKLAEQEAQAVIGRGIAGIGVTVACTYKGEEVRGLITKVSEKTVSVKLSDLEGNPINGKNDKQVVTWKYFHQIQAI